MAASNPSRRDYGDEEPDFLESEPVKRQPKQPATPNSQRRKALGWVRPGELLKVKNRVIDVRHCQITFSPTRLKSFEQPSDEDAIDSVEFWFSYPVAGALLYVFNPDSGLLEPYEADKPIGLPQHFQWMIQYKGKLARAIRLMYRDITEPPACVK